MKAFVLTDMEGVAGVVSFQDQSYATGRYYEAARRLATAEVNAAVEGLLLAGVDDILVWDGHGDGAILYEELHPEARLLHGRPSPPMGMILEVMQGCDLAAIVGQHAMAGVRDGNQSHTQSSQGIEHYMLNGRPIGEIAQAALAAGALGVPLVFLSGDAAACREAEELIPGVTTATVKWGLTRNAAISLSADKARDRIRQGIDEAVRRQRKAPIPPLQWEGPYVLEIRYHSTADADRSAARAGAERVDAQTVRFASGNILDIIYN